MSKDFTVTAKVPAKKDEKGNIITNVMAATITVQVAESLAEAKEMFGEEASLTNMNANWRTTLQANIRSSLKAGLTPEQIQDKLTTAIMGIAQVGTHIDPQTAFIAKFKSATQEEQTKMLERLRSAAEDSPESIDN